MLARIYVRSALQPFTPARLPARLGKARLYNDRHRVTGMLLYEHQKFMQVIEGGRDAVDDLFDKIRRGARHCDVLVPRSFSGCGC